MSKSKQNVTHIASGDLWAGAEVQLFTLCSNLKDINVNVILLNHGELEKRLKKHGIPVIVIDESKTNGIKILLKLIKILRNSNTHIVHTHRIKENILGGIAAKLAGNIPSVRTVHGAPEHKPDLKKPLKKLQYMLEWFIGRYVQKKIIAVSRDLKEKLTDEYPQQKICVIENGIDVNALNPIILKRQENYEFNSPYIIGIIGRLVPVKRVDIFIETAKLFSHNNPHIEIEFHIYGDGPLRTSLEHLAANNTFFAGHRLDIHEKIADLDALLITSDHEGLPMTLLEAMAIGTPIISSPVGGIPKVLDKGTYGTLVNNNTAKDFYNAINNILNNQEKITTMSNNATNWIKKEYSASTNALNYYNLYMTIS